MVVNTLLAAASVVRAAVMNGLTLIGGRVHWLSGRDVLRTDQHGTITVETDGEQLWVEAAR